MRCVEVPGITDVDTSREAGMPQEEIRVDRDKAADLGLSVRDVAEALETAVAGSRAGEYRAGGNSYRILVQLADAEKLSLDEILDLTLRSEYGEHVALRNLVDDRSRPRPDPHRAQGPAAHRHGRRPTSPAATSARSPPRCARPLEQIPRPVGYDLHVAGNFEEQQKAFDELVVSLLLALVLVYMVLACQYESLRDPLVVMFSVPLAAIGVLVTLFLTEHDAQRPVLHRLHHARRHRGQQRDPARRPGRAAAPATGMGDSTTRSPRPAAAACARS